MKAIHLYLSTIIPTLIFLSGVASAQLLPFGLTGETILCLAAEREDYPPVSTMSNKIAAGTIDNGVYIAEPFDEQHAWKQYGLESRKINALTIQHWGAGPRDGLTLIAGAEALTGAVRADIFRRALPVMFQEDSVWVPSDSGVDKQRTGSINALAAYYYTGQTPPQPVLAGLSYGVLQGYPAGVFWSEATIDSMANVNALDVRPHWFGDLAWAAGRLSLAAAAFHSFDKGRTWTTSMLPSAIEGEAFSVAINQRNPDTVYVGGMNAVWMTPDSGATWQMALAAPCNFHALAIDALNPSDVYAGGSSFQNECFFFHSTNGGINWTRIQSQQGDTIAGVTSLAIVNEDSLNDPANRKPAVFLGTNGTGVWKYHPDAETATVDPAAAGGGIDLLSCYPNPVREGAAVTFTTRKSNRIRVQLRDIFGRIAWENTESFFHEGKHVVPISATSLAAGTYIATVVSDIGAKHIRIQIVK